MAVKSEVFIDEFRRLNEYLLKHDEKPKEIEKKIIEKGHPFYGITKSQMIARGWSVYVSLEVWEGKLVERQFAFAFFRKNIKDNIEFIFVELLRKILGNNHLSESNAFYNTMGGNKIEQKNATAWFHNRNWQKDFSYLAEDEDCESLEPYLDQFGIRYSMYENPKNRSHLPRINYLTRYLNYPKIELLVKSGFSHLITECRYMNMHAKTMPEILKLTNPFLIESVLKGHLSLSEARKREQLFKKYGFTTENQFSIYDVAKYNFGDKEFFLKNAKSIVNYVDKSDPGSRNFIIDYKDYLEAAKKLNINLEEKKHLCPPISEFKKLHDEYTARVEVIANKDLNDKLESVAKRLLKTVSKAESDKFALILPIRVDEIKREGKTLHHCVAQYIDQIVDGKTAVVFLREVAQLDEPYYTIEIKNKKLSQVRGLNNKSLDNTDAIDFLKDWCFKTKIQPTAITI